MIQAMEGFEPGYKPMILYIFVDKRINHRIFEKDGNNGGEYFNPGPGTTLDAAFVEEDGPRIFDFYMIPHKATVATALPVHYRVAYNTTDMDKNAIETTTFHLCYGYFNFAGGIKVPAAVMYAHKLAAYAHDNKVHPNDDLSNNLHYL